MYSFVCLFYVILFFLSYLLWLCRFSSFSPLPQFELSSLILIEEGGVLDGQTGFRSKRKYGLALACADELLLSTLCSTGCPWMSSCCCFAPVRCVSRLSSFGLLLIFLYFVYLHSPDRNGQAYQWRLHPPPPSPLRLSVFWSEMPFFSPFLLRYYMFK